MKLRRILVTLLLLVVGVLAGHAESITVFAAASLTESLEEIAALYEGPTTDKIVFNFAGSGPLRRQIEEGAPADVLFSADEATMDGLQSKGLLLTETRLDRLSNTLVIVTPDDRPLALSTARDLANPTLARLAIGDPRTVPAGTYAKEYLTKLGLWASLDARIVPCENVRAVLAAVESGNVDAGIVYRTDAGIAKSVKIALEIPRKEGPQIRYPLAVLKDSKRPDAARRFVAFLAGPEAGRVFERRGFIVLPSPPAR